MKNRILLLVLFVGCVNQVPAWQNGTVAKPNSLRADVVNFYRQLILLPEYKEERAKIPDMQKASKATVKVKAVVDTESVATSANDDDDDQAGQHKLMGYIHEEVGTKSVNVYEVTYDRAKRKITAVVPTGDSLEITKPKPRVKKGAAKKADTGDADDEDEPDTKPVKKKTSAKTPENDDDN